uniref:Uncharacterized protein n=1 Tax=Myotis myotis TaxID=51298 RepID=A0A7J7QW39_MYOMY|nr:hypothetical protein mMyoMyo1_001643 [Myotis myotis]
MVEAMGSTLSPGAQQLMSMVRFQQQRCIPLGEQLQAVLGSAASRRMLGLWASAPSGTCDRPTCAPVPLRAGLTPGRGTEDVTAPGEEDARPPGGGNPAPSARSGVFLTKEAERQACGPCPRAAAPPPGRVRAGAPAPWGSERRVAGTRPHAQRRRPWWWDGRAARLLLLGKDSV